MRRLVNSRSVQKHRLIHENQYRQCWFCASCQLIQKISMSAFDVPAMGNDQPMDRLWCSGKSTSRSAALPIYHCSSICNRMMYEASYHRQALRSFVPLLILQWARFGHRRNCCRLKHARHQGIYFDVRTVQPEVFHWSSPLTIEQAYHP